jgi:hypothetical protein
MAASHSGVGHKALRRGDAQALPAAVSLSIAPDTLAWSVSTAQTDSGRSVDGIAADDERPSIGSRYRPNHMKVSACLTANTSMMTSTTVRRGRGSQSFLSRLRYAHRAANLGAVETIVASPTTTSHVELTAAQRARLGIPEGLVRYSAEIEDITDLLADLTQALE